jgi:hypothetical protein
MEHDCPVRAMRPVVGGDVELLGVNSPGGYGTMSFPDPVTEL